MINVMIIYVFFLYLLYLQHMLWYMFLNDNRKGICICIFSCLGSESYRVKLLNYNKVKYYLCNLLIFVINL